MHRVCSLRSGRPQQFGGRPAAHGCNALRTRFGHLHTSNIQKRHKRHQTSILPQSVIKLASAGRRRRGGMGRSIRPRQNFVCTLQAMAMLKAYATDNFAARTPRLLPSQKNVYVPLHLRFYTSEESQRDGGHPVRFAEEVGVGCSENRKSCLLSRRADEIFIAELAGQTRGGLKSTCCQACSSASCVAYTASHPGSQSAAPAPRRRFARRCRKIRGASPADQTWACSTS